MQYLGGKSKIGKKIAKYIDWTLPKHGGRYFEPFIGGMNILWRLKKVSHAILSDVHPGLILMYRAYDEGWRPPTLVTREEYEEIKAKFKRDGKYTPKSVFVSFACAFGGKEFGVYACKKDYFDNYAIRGSNALKRKLGNLSGHEFRNSHYNQVDISGSHTIYCDPPYRGTASYKTGDKFNSQQFDLWCEKMTRAGHTVLVSEFNAPEHWKVIWKCERIEYIGTKKKKSKVTDKLFLVKPK